MYFGVDIFRFHAIIVTNVTKKLHIKKWNRNGKGTFLT